MIQTYIKLYKTIREDLLKLKAELGDWNEVSKKLYLDSKKLTDEEKKDLYNQVFGLQDIDKAEILSLLCDKLHKKFLSLKEKPLEYIKI